MKWHPKPWQFDAMNLSAILDEIETYLEDRQDVRDGSDGPRPNEAMALLNELREARATLSGERNRALEEAAQLVADAECLPTCGGFGHDEKCPVVYPEVAIRALKTQIAGSEMIPPEAIRNAALEELLDSYFAAFPHGRLGDAYRALKSPINAERTPRVPNGQVEMPGTSNLPSAPDAAEMPQDRMGGISRNAPGNSPASSAYSGDLPAAAAPIQAHSKSEYRRISAQGGNVLPPAAPSAGETPETDAQERERDALRRELAGAAPSAEVLEWANEILVHAAEYDARSIECAIEIVRIHGKLKGTP
jgi:hypothetical protein